MLIPVLLFIVGLLCLIKGGDWFVDGATGIARRFHVPELLIGATVVSIGTTLPEVMVSTTSALTGHGEIAYGNAIGSIICNASLIAALTIAVKPGKVDPKSLRTPVLFFFVAAAFYAGVAYTTGYFSRPVGLILLAMFAAYVICNVMAMTSLAKGHGALSLGNVIGANVFNLVLVSGVSATVAPFTIPQNSLLFGHNASLVLEFPVMFAVMLLLTLPALFKGKLSRPQGIALLCIYAAFCVVQFTI